MATDRGTVIRTFGSLPGTNRNYVPMLSRLLTLLEAWSGYHLSNWRMRSWYTPIDNKSHVIQCKYFKHLYQRSYIAAS
jgi:hypothetical protein